MKVAILIFAYFPLRCVFVIKIQNYTSMKRRDSELNDTSNVLRNHACSVSWFNFNSHKTVFEKRNNTHTVIATEPHD